jgi:hypothetical protein
VEELIWAFQEKRIDQEQLQSSVRALNAEIAALKGEAIAESVAASLSGTQEEMTHDEAKQDDEESVELLTQSGKAIDTLMHKRKERSNSVIYVEVVGSLGSEHLELGIVG